jgi:hypothetical protein
MNVVNTILVKSLVKTFYRQHAGLFVFLFIVMFGAVGRVDNAGLLDYHLSLVRAMLGNPFLFIIILFLWFLYSQKSAQYIVSTFRRPDFSFLHMLSLLGRRQLFRLMLWVQFLLLIPIIIYLLIIFIAGFYSHLYIPCLAAMIYLLVIWIVTAHWYLFVIQNPGRPSSVTKTGAFFKRRQMPYWGLFLRYIARNKKLLLMGIKLYSCCILYLMVINQTKVAYDLSMITLFFSLGILGHGLLIHQLRDFEETRIAFYRPLPISIFRRFAQYAILYIVLLIPEILTIILLTPKYLHVKDAVLFFLLAYSVLLFLNSLLFIEFFRMKDYLKITLCIFFALFLSVLTVTLPLLCLLFFLFSIGIFFWKYDRFERVTVF